MGNNVCNLIAQFSPGVFAVAGTDPVEKVRGFVGTFTGILYEALPFIVLGAILAGILEEFIPQRWIMRLIPRNRYLAIAVGCLLGLPFPMCECGILVIMRRLLRKGVPLSTCAAYMLAGPIINVVVMLSTFVAFRGMERTIVSGQTGPQLGGVGMMAARMGFGFLVAYGTGLVVEWQYRRHGNKLLSPSLVALLPPPMAKLDSGANGTATDAAPAEPRSLLQRLNTAVEVALHDFVDVMVYLVLGAFLAALTRVFVSPEQVAEFSHNLPAVAILLMMGMAILLCICSEADAFVAASYATMKPAAKLAFLLLGPMLDLKLYTMYLRIYRPRLIWTIIGCVVIQVFVYSMLFSYFWDAGGWQQMQQLLLGPGN